ncbi:MAG: bifunctional riboflavin kinase/FAD synthetase, partial [Dehalococcoidales bacterium]|nr:bifunctional riboflavin kinase/FAD synthetase [Dehalococcoidales bacterium]
LVVGSDFALGKKRGGDTATLRKLGEEMGFSVTVVAPLKINGETVSSTAIRQAMALGDMHRVYNLTGRYFSLHGTVVSGVGRGQRLGFPTANISVDSAQALPPDGVYAGFAHINGKVYPSVTNIGMNPTFGSSRRSIETHVIDYHGDLYGHDLKIELVARLRDERKFKDAEELRKQLAEDVAVGKNLLKSAGSR